MNIFKHSVKMSYSIMNYVQVNNNNKTKFFHLTNKVTCIRVSAMKWCFFLVASGTDRNPNWTQIAISRACMQFKFNLLLFLFFLFYLMNEWQISYNYRNFQQTNNLCESFIMLKWMTSSPNSLHCQIGFVLRITHLL